MKVKYALPKYHKINKDYGYMYGNTEHHGEIFNLRDLRRAGTYSMWMGLFYKGQAVGSGRLCKQNWSQQHVHSENMGIEKGYRRKGHGIMLYHALILLAKRLKVKRLYSSDTLNDRSRRMWRIKLARLGYNVVELKNCRRPCKHCHRDTRYYIDL